MSLYQVLVRKGDDPLMRVVVRYEQINDVMSRSSGLHICGKYTDLPLSPSGIKMKVVLFFIKNMLASTNPLRNQNISDLFQVDTVY